MLNVLEVVTRHTSVRGWMDMCHDLGRVRKWLLHIWWITITFNPNRRGKL